MEHSAEPPPRAEYVATAAGDHVICLRHGPDAAPAATGVVLVGPLAWEDVASYRARLVWAQRLAAAGHPVARFDLPGTGDSTGGPADDDRLGRWVAAVVAVAARLRADAGCPRVALLGIGFGGLLAALATAAEPVAEDLILWDAPASGRSAVRKLKAFTRLQGDGGLADELPEGWLEVSGSLLSAELLSALDAADLSALEPRGVRRALILRSDGATEDPTAARLSESGAEVEEAEGPGYTEMVEHPQFLVEPEETMAAVQRWLAAAAAGAPAEPAGLAAPEASATLTLPDGTREEPIVLPTPGGAVFGVLTHPAEPAADGVCALMLPAGAVRRVGPNRMWVELARRWAAAGVPSLRLDVPGIGDAGGDAHLHRETTGFHRGDVMAALPAVLDELERRGAGSRFLPLGLCSGAYNAWWLAATDPRVAGVALLNPRVLSWDAENIAWLDGQRMAERLTLGRAKDLLAGRVSRAAVRRAAVHAGRLARARVGRAVRGGRAEAPLPASLGLPLADAVAHADARGLQMLLGFSGEERLPLDLDRPEVQAQLRSARNVERVELPGTNHELRTVVAQRAAQEQLDALLERVRAGVAQPSRP